MKNINKDLVDYYASYDKDYKKTPVVHSVYDKYSPNVYLVSGNDAYRINEFAKPIGRARSESISTFGHSRSYDVKMAAKHYFDSVKSFLKNSCSRVKDSDKNLLILNGYFETKYNRRGEISGYKLKGINFTKEYNTSPVNNPDLAMIPQKSEYQMTLIH